MKEPLLAVCSLEYVYPGGVTALRGLNLRIEQGRKLAILGSNGSGKTTLLLHLNGLCKPSCGEIRLEGQTVRYDHQALNHWRRRVGLILQEPDDQLFAATVRQDVSFGPLNLGLSDAEADARVREALEALHIAHLANRATHTLSFGQKKRVKTVFDASLGTHGRVILNAGRRGLMVELAPNDAVALLNAGTADLTS